MPLLLHSVPPNGCVAPLFIPISAVSDSGGMEFIMSKWKETQNNIVRELHIDNVTEEIKQRVSASIVNEVLPPIEDAVNKFSTIIQA